MSDALDRSRALLQATEGHTPGPFRKSGRTRIKAGKMVVAIIPCGGMTGEQRDLNARFFAAAPDLRAAVAEMVAEVERLREALELLSRLISSCERPNKEDPARWYVAKGKLRDWQATMLEVERFLEEPAIAAAIRELPLSGTESATQETQE